MRHCVMLFMQESFWGRFVHILGTPGRLLKVSTF